MIYNTFAAAMTEQELAIGEARHSKGELSRIVAMTAGLTKSSEELSETWELDSKLYLTALKGAITAYDDNKDLEDLLVGCIARLASVVDGEYDGVVGRAIEIIRDAEPSQS